MQQPELPCTPEEGSSTPPKKQRLLAPRIRKLAVSCQDSRIRGWWFGVGLQESQLPVLPLTKLCDLGQVTSFLKSFSYTKGIITEPTHRDVAGIK